MIQCVCLGKLSTWFKLNGKRGKAEIKHVLAVRRNHHISYIFTTRRNLMWLHYFGHSLLLFLEPLFFKNHQEITIRVAIKQKNSRRIRSCFQFDVCVEHQNNLRTRRTFIFNVSNLLLTIVRGWVNKFVIFWISCFSRWKFYWIV